MFQNAPEIVLPGRYYFAPEGTPHYEQVHVYGSRNWMAGEFAEPSVLGEVATGRRWSNGAAPPRLPLPRIVGGEPCVRDGAFWPVPGDLPRTVIDGMDSRCFAPDFVAPPDPQICALDAPALQAAVARLLELVYEEEFLEIKGIMNAWFGLPTQLSSFPVNEELPARDYFRLPDGGYMVLISGTTTPQQWALQGFSALAGPTDFGAFSSNAVWVHTASVMLDEMLAQSFDHTKPIFLAGHSYGAAVAALLAARFKFWAPDRDVCLLTYGLPKPGDQRTVNHVVASKHVDIATAEDVVTALPPDLRELAPFSALLPFGLADLWASWRPLPSYLVVQADASAAWSSPPYMDSGLLGPLLALVLAGDPLPTFAAHLIGTYVARLKARQPAVAWPLTAPAWALLFP